jgi:cardiolipin synthase
MCGDAQPGLDLSIPNLITLARILSVPIMVWAIASGEMLFAFVLFAVAGISDAVDGFLAKRFGMASELGAYLDPLADKTLLVSIYVTLGIEGNIARWLVILVVSRDVMIVGAVMLSWLVGKPIAVKPLLVSKVNTAAQIVLVGLVLGSLGFGIELGVLLTAATYVVAALTLISVGAYVREWVLHMGSPESQV